MGYNMRTVTEPFNKGKKTYKIVIKTIVPRGKKRGYQE